MRDQTQLQTELISALITTLRPDLLETDVEFMEGIFARLIEKRPVSIGHVDDIHSMISRADSTRPLIPTEESSDPSPTDPGEHIAGWVDKMDAEELVAPSQSPLFGDLYPRCVDCCCSMVPVGEYNGILKWQCTHPDCGGDVT